MTASGCTISSEAALLPQAREAVEALPDRDGLVFRSKRGRRLAQPTMSGYWSQILARARLDFDFYLATKHYGVHHMKVKLGLPDHDIAEQAGWSEGGGRRDGEDLRPHVDGRARLDQGRGRGQA